MLCLRMYLTDHTLLKIDISISDQKLTLYDADKPLLTSMVSTAENGFGQKINSFQTPLGLHFIAEKSGENAKIKTYFQNRQPLGLFQPSMLSKYDDWILTRVIRLAGAEAGYNQGDDCDSYERMIYIHGTPELIQANDPKSHGCIRMPCIALIALYNMINIGTKVEIHV